MENSSDVFGTWLASLFAFSAIGFSAFINIIYCLMCLVLLVTTVLWIIMLIDVLRREEDQFPAKGENQKMLWVLILLFGGIIGAIIYYILVYSKKKI